MSNYIRSLQEIKQHFVAFVADPYEPLIDEPIKQSDRKTPIWHHCFAEVWTPRSLPLRIQVTLGAKNGLRVMTANTLLLELFMADLGTDVALLLPIEELLRVRVEPRQP